MNIHANEVRASRGCSEIWTRTFGLRRRQAAKLEKVFARPFIGAVDGHIDAIFCMVKNKNHLKGIFSGSMDGVGQFPGHQGGICGLTSSTDGLILVSCGNYCTVRLWNVPSTSGMESDDPSNASHPLAVYVWKNAFWGFDQQCDGDLFATAGALLDIWNHNRSNPVNTFEWGKDTVISVRFDPGEPNILATSASDCSITIYDLPTVSPARKLIMMTKTNFIAWNAMEPMNFTAANDDCKCYSYDMRKSDEAKCVHKDHVSAVMDIDYSPSGREFVTGSYDRTNISVQWWSQQGSISHLENAKLLPCERRKHEYLEAIKNWYKHLPEVKRIVRHRHLPKPIFKAAALRRAMTKTERRIEERRRAHSGPGSMTEQPLQRKRIIKEVE